MIFINFSSADEDAKPIKIDTLIIPEPSDSCLIFRQKLLPQIPFKSAILIVLFLSSLLLGMTKEDFLL